MAGDYVDVGQQKEKWGPEKKNGKSGLFPFSEPVIILIVIFLFLVISACFLLLHFFLSIYLAA